MYKNIFIIILIAGAVYLSSDNIESLLSKNLDFSKPKFRNLRLTESENSTIGFDLGLEVTNNTFLPIPIDYIEGSLVINGVQVGNFFDSRPFVLSPNSNTLIDLGIDISNSGIIQTISGLFSGNIPTNMFLEGYAIVKGAKLNFTRPIINRV